MLLLAPARSAFAGTLSLADYIRLLERIETAARQQSASALRELADELATTESVVMPDGAQVRLRHADMPAWMRRADSGRAFELIAARAGALLIELREAQQRAALPAQDALAARDAALNDPNLQRPLATPAPRPTPAQRPPALQLPRIGVDAIRFALVVAGGIGVIAVIVTLGPLLFRLLAARRRAASRDAEADAEVATSVEAVARAQEASVIQDYRLAMRMLYLACLLKLDESGVLRYDRTQTNREYVRQIADRPALAGALQPVVEVFDDVWYGFRPITPQGYAAFESRVRDLLALAAAAPGPARDGK